MRKVLFSLALLVFVLGCARFSPSKEAQEKYFGKGVSLGFKGVVVGKWAVYENGTLFVEFRNAYPRQLRIVSVRLVVGGEDYTEFLDLELAKGMRFGKNFLLSGGFNSSEPYWVFMHISFEDSETLEWGESVGNLSGVVLSG